jgi:hypothetical protein
VFWQKRLQPVENKGNECRKERKETTKRLQVSENMGFATEAHRGTEVKIEVCTPTPPGVLCGCETKGVAEKGICKLLITGGLQIDGGKRGICKLMKTREAEVLGNGKWRVLSGEWRSLEGRRYWRYVVHVTRETTGYENTQRAAGGMRDETGTLSATLG